ncbi:MAG TPA: hypothetical protein VF752_08010 [Thermoleophilaceae bacterium]
MRSLAWRLRAAALVLAGALAVHELRYLVAYQGDSGRALSLQGHAYLSLVTPLVCALIAVAAAHFVGRLARGGSDEATPGFAATWLWASLSLVAIFVVQESVEGLVASGHPGGLAAVVGHGGWLAAPIAFAVGGVIALLLRGASVALAAAARRARPPVSRVTPLVRRPPLGVTRPRQHPLALKLAGRAPPRASVLA